MTPREAIEIEIALAHCAHPYTDKLYSFGRWCNICGAIKLAEETEWTLPHWRDRIVLAKTP